MPSPQSLELTLVRELAAGTFARLYLAEARAPGGVERLIAVKLLREQWNDQPDLLARTGDEARLLARLRHRNIVRVEDTATIEGQFALLMEFVDGLDCKQLIEARGGTKHRTVVPGPGNPKAALPARAALAIVAASASALDAAHHKTPLGLDHPLQVVHRDIKPSNLMVSADGEVKVLDFGTARFAESSRQAQTREMRFGSLKYMSPERREGDRGELPADVYALGLVLLELLRGEWLPVLPLDGAEHDEAIAAYVAALPAGAMPNQEWEDAFHRLIQGMTASNPAWRPGCAEAATLLRTFHDQASGPSIEEFAAEAIAPVARANRKLPIEGELAGRRYVVSARAFEPDPRTSGETPRLVAQEVSGAPRPATVTRAAVVEDPSASGTHPGAGGTQPGTGGTQPGGPAPAAAPPLALPAGAEGDAAFWTSAFARRLPGLLENDLSTRPTVIETPAERASATGEIGRGAAAGVHRSFPDGVLGHPRGGPTPHPSVPAVLDGQAPSRSPTVPFEPRTLIVESTRTVISEGPPPEAPAPAGPPARVPRRALTFEPPPPAEPPTPVAPPLPPEPEEPVDEEEPVAAPNWFARIVAVGLGVTVAGGVLLLLTTAAVAFVFRDRWMGPASATSPLVASASPAASAEPPPAQSGGAPAADVVNPSAPPGGAPGAEPSLGAPPAAEAPSANAVPATTDARASVTDPSTQGAATTEPAPTTPVQVTIWVKTASPQWIHLQSPSGDDLAQGSDRCSAQVPPGDYRLVVKLVGRPAVSGALKLTGSEVRMECVPQPDASVTCSGGGLPVYLKP